MSAICALRRLTSASCRVAARAMLHSGWTLLVAQHVSPTAPLLSATARAFSTTPSRFSAGASDVLFSQKLTKELKSEKESEPLEEPDFLKSFRAQGVWTIEDIEGDSTVTLTRTFGNESICLIFSIMDIQNIHSLAELEHGAGEGQEKSHLIRTSFVITKDGTKKWFNVNAVWHRGGICVVNIMYYPEYRGLPVSMDWDRHRTLALDMSLWKGFDEWFDARGMLSESLAAFIPEYVEYKEQKEYVKWLENVKNFVEA